MKGNNIPKRPSRRGGSVSGVVPVWESLVVDSGTADGMKTLGFGLEYSLPPNHGGGEEPGPPRLMLPER